MKDAKQYVLSRFPGAGVRKVGGVFRLEGVPGLSSAGINEDYTWAGAASDLLDPVLEISRGKAVCDSVLEAFATLGGSFSQPMALAKCLEQRGFTAAEAVSAINAVLEAGALVQTDTGSISLP